MLIEYVRLKQEQPWVVHYTQRIRWMTLRCPRGVFRNCVYAMGLHSLLERANDVPTGPKRAQIATRNKQKKRLPPNNI